MKKLKLSLSICMMCLCIAVLCMGILASSSATYNISGNISYNMIDGVARINTRVYKVAGDPASESDLQTAVTGTFLTTSSFAVVEANQSPIYAQTYQNKETLEYTDTPTTKDYDINVVYGANNDADAYYTYYVVIQIYNQTETSGYVLNASITKTDGTEIANTDSSYVATNTSVSSVARDTFSNIVIGISAQTIAKAQALTNSTETFAYKLSVTYGEVPLPTFSELLDTYTDGNNTSYWGVPLGKIASDSETPIIWRYVGDYSTSSDGTETFTRYETYSSTKPTVGNGSVFVQETALTNNSVAWGSSDTDYNYFTESTLRENVKSGLLFNLTLDEQAYLTRGYIKAINLPKIGWAQGYGLLPPRELKYPCTEVDSLMSDDSESDYFWLMSIAEVFDFFVGTQPACTWQDDQTWSDLVWETSEGSADIYWLRNPVLWRSDEWIALVGSDGAISWLSATKAVGVRAAFRLE